jgi:CheY-like chemotaxis protein
MVRTDPRPVIKVLVVEDPARLGQFLKQGLSECHYTVTWVGTCAEAASALAQTPCDVIVLDLSLPDGDGLDLLRRRRASGFNEPVLILSARDSLQDRIKGLDLGADDYREVLLALLALTVAVSVGLGYGLSRLVLQPVRPIQATACRIRSDYLAVRIPVGDASGLLSSEARENPRAFALRGSRPRWPGPSLPAPVRAARSPPAARTHCSGWVRRGGRRSDRSEWLRVAARLLPRSA